jgi:hypothetical protein
MNRCGWVFMLCIVTPLFFGCAAKINKPEWQFEKEAIKVHIRADPKLNLYNSKAHTLYVCFYQLSALNDFDQLSQAEAGIRQLLECKLFAPSVAAVNSKVIHSGENLTFILDRAEHAQYFAIVTGYFAKLDNDRMIRRHKIRVFKKRKNLWKNEYRCMPCDMEIELTLGPNQIEYSKIVEKNEACADECQ